MEAVERTLELESSPESVWRAITDPAEISCWFGDSAKISLEVGSEGWFSWQQHGKFPLRVEECRPITRFAWRWTHNPGERFDESDSTLVEWTLTPRESGGTTLHLRESGFATEKRRAENNEGWTKELKELEDYLASA